MMKFSQILPVAALGIALSVGGVQKAEAYAYAYSDLYVSGGSITILPPTDPLDPLDVPLLTDFEAGETSGVAPAGFFDTANGTTTSTSSAALEGGSGESKNDNTDAAVSVGDGSSFPGGVPGNNDFALQGTSTTDAYTWADSQVISEQSLNGAGIYDPARYEADGSPSFNSLIETHQIAEGNVTDGTLGTSGASTTSTTEFSATFAVNGGGAILYFDFDAVLAMFVEITAPHTGVLAEAGASIVISITDENAAPGTPAVFNWVVGFDPFAGTLVESAFILSDGINTNTAGSVGVSGGSGHFAAYTDLLAAGQYKVKLTTTVSERVQAQTIPAPDTLALFGLGVIALGLRQRKIKLKLAA